MRSRLHNRERNAGRPRHAANNGGSRPNLNLDTWNDALRSLPVAAVTESDLLAWVEGPLRQFFPFDKFLGVYGKISGGRIQMLSLVSRGHTPQFLATLENRFDQNVRGCIAWWVSNQRPFILDQSGALDEEGTRICASERELDEVERFSLGIVAAHGVIDPFANAGTYFSFSGVAKSQPAQTMSALKLIAPALHALFLRTKRTENSSIDLTVLTKRQKELVDLALLGLPDKAIASRLAISDNTVGSHFRAIYAKLGIGKRSQLIALLK